MRTLEDLLHATCASVVESVRGVSAKIPLTCRSRLASAKMRFPNASENRCPSLQLVHNGVYSTGCYNGSRCDDDCSSRMDSQFGLVRVYHEHREQLGRLRLAGIGADGVAVTGQFEEALSGHWRSIKGFECKCGKLSEPSRRSRSRPTIRSIGFLIADREGYTGCKSDFFMSSGWMTGFRRIISESRIISEINRRCP